MIPTYEKIETIVLSYLQSRIAQGAMGTLVEVEPSVYRVVADGKTVIVFRTMAGWNVRFKSIKGTDRDLLTAARFALDGGSKIEVSKHADLAGDLEVKP